MPPFCFPKSIKIASWRLLGPSWSVLEASWGVVGASWSVLGGSWSVLETSWRRLGASWARLGAFQAQKERARSRFPAPGVQLRNSAVGQGNLHSQRRRTLQTLYRPLQTPFQRTPTRSWAPSGPVRISNAQQSCDPATAPGTTSLV